MYKAVFCFFIIQDYYEYITDSYKSNFAVCFFYFFSVLPTAIFSVFLL